MKPASTATTTPMMIVMTYGVRNVGWTFANTLRQQAVARHREGDPALPQQQDHHDHGDAGGRTDRDDVRDAVMARRW